MWLTCPQSALIHSYSYLPLGLCSHHFLATVLVPRTLLYPKCIWFLCHLTLAWSSLSFCKPSSSSSDCSLFMCQGLPLTICSTLTALRLCVWTFPLYICSPGLPSHTQLQFWHHSKDTPMSYSGSYLPPCSSLHVQLHSRHLRMFILEALRIFLS